MGLLTDVLSRIDAMKRRAGGLLSNPEDTLAAWLAPDPTDPNLGAVGSVMPGVSQAAIHGLLAGDYQKALDVALNSPMGFLGKIVYHGSPHTFDKFDMSKIGTGEGAQAYGHGLYFAENPATAKAYVDDLGRRVPAFNGVPVRDTAESFAHDILSKYEPSVAKKVVDSYVDGGVFKGGDAEGMRKSIYAAIDRYAAAKPGLANTGNLYRVDIPDEAIDKMLHWDKPLSEQPQALAALKEGGIFTGEKQFDGWRALIGPGGVYVNPADPAQRAYIAAAQVMGEPQAAHAFRDAGIPGIKYLDQGSRAAKDGTHNYVLFDDSLANIVGRE